MSRIVLTLMSTLSALVLLFSYHTSTGTGAAAAPASQVGSASPGVTSTTAPSTSSSASGTYTGDAVSTRWGTVQVRITVVNGKITRSEAVQYPQGNGRDQEINAYAVPQLNQEVVQAQGAGIDAVSGATVTSDGYIQSLQSAIDQAHL